MFSWDNSRIVTLSLLYRAPSLLEVKVKSLSHVRLFATPWTVAYQASLSMGFSRQECWSGLPFPSPGDLPDPGIESVSLTSPAFTGVFLTSSTTWEAPYHRLTISNSPSHWGPIHHISCLVPRVFHLPPPFWRFIDLAELVLWGSTLMKPWDSHCLSFLCWIHYLSGSMFCSFLVNSFGEVYPWCLPRWGARK